MNLNSLKPATGSTRKPKRIARGTGSGLGGTSTRGHKGAKARAGFKSKRAHEGGQMPLQMRLPKGGFKNTHPRYKSFNENIVTFNLSDLQFISDKHNLTEITPSILCSLGYISSKENLKILGNGDLQNKLDISASLFSKNAKLKVSNSGGKCFIIFKSNYIQGIAKSINVNNITPNEIANAFDYVDPSDFIHIIAEGNLSIKFDLSAHKIDDETLNQLNNLGSKFTLL
jgi:large subunit ribosomal protein L15